MTRANAPRGPRSGGLASAIERSGAARPLLRSVRLRRTVENTAGIFRGEKTHPAKEHKRRSSEPDTFRVAC